MCKPAESSIELIFQCFFLYPHSMTTLECSFPREPQNISKNFACESRHGVKSLILQTTPFLFKYFSNHWLNSFEKMILIQDELQLYKNHRQVQLTVSSASRSHESSHKQKLISSFAQYFLPIRDYFTVFFIGYTF